MALISSRIVEGEKIAIAPPCRKFMEVAKANLELEEEYIDLSRRITDFFSTVLEETPIVLTDNVTEYLYGTEAQRSNAKWDLADLPVVVPPFTSVFLETKSPRDTAKQDVSAWGAFFSRSDEASDIGNSEIGADDVKWLVEMSLLFDDKGVIKTHPVVYGFFLDSQGQFLTDSGEGILFETYMLAREELAEVIEGDPQWEGRQKSSIDMALPFFFSFAFMHCKNVSLVPPHVSRQVKRQAERSGKPLLDYRILNIEPMKAILKKEGNLDEVGPKTALHICRGHFKDYRDGPGLFGKLRGVYWWEGSVRGSLSRGKVEKDYKVNPPTQKPDA